MSYPIPLLQSGDNSPEKRDEPLNLSLKATTPLGIWSPASALEREGRSSPMDTCSDGEIPRINGGEKQHVRI